MLYLDIIKVCSSGMEDSVQLLRSRNMKMNKNNNEIYKLEILGGIYMA